MNVFCDSSPTGPHPIEPAPPPRCRRPRRQDQGFRVAASLGPQARESDLSRIHGIPNVQPGFQLGIGGRGPDRRFHPGMVATAHPGAPGRPGDLLLDSGFAGAWRSLVAHQSGGLVVVGSNPAAPTIFRTNPLALVACHPVTWRGRGYAVVHTACRRHRHPMLDQDRSSSPAAASRVTRTDARRLGFASRRKHAGRDRRSGWDVMRRHCPSEGVLCAGSACWSCRPRP